MMCRLKEALLPIGQCRAEQDLQIDMFWWRQESRVAYGACLVFDFLFLLWYLRFFAFFAGFFCERHM